MVSYRSKGKEVCSWKALQQVLSLPYAYVLDIRVTKGPTRRQKFINYLKCKKNQRYFNQKYYEDDFRYKIKYKPKDQLIMIGLIIKVYK